MLAAIHSAGVHGIAAYGVTVEVDVHLQGLPGWHVVGLPETTVRESKDRVTAAVRNAGCPVALRKTTINLAPAGLRKEGNYFDLPIAVGLLIASELLEPECAQGFLFAGELLLSGVVHRVPNLLAIAKFARDHQLTLIAPRANRGECELVRGLTFHTVEHLQQMLEILNARTSPTCAAGSDRPPLPQYPDFCDVKGQHRARRALEIAAAGGHHLLMLGPPGAGKSMIAQRLPSILPALSLDEALTVTCIQNARQTHAPTVLHYTRPFRAPHHTTSAIGLTGGGSTPRLGELTLAHHGVLFLDELGEFPRNVIEVLRQPLEQNEITVSRAQGHVTFPAAFQLIAASNPCKCGFYGHPKQFCACTLAQLQNYRARLSGPLLDRIDLHVWLDPLSPQELLEATPGETSEAIRTRVLAARTMQHARYGQTRVNAGLGSRGLAHHCPLSAQTRELLSRAATEHHLSARSFDRIVRVARTIADLGDSAEICAEHVTEAIGYRLLDQPL